MSTEMAEKRSAMAEIWANAYLLFSRTFWHTKDKASDINAVATNLLIFRPVARIVRIVLYMNLRIDHIHADQQNVIHIAGHLCGRAVAQLKAACKSIEGPLVVDLSSLLYADDEGIVAIRAIIDKGATIQGASPFIELLLEGREFERRLSHYRGRSIWS